MRSLVETLCSPACAGRAPGTPGGRAARAAVVEALRGAGLDPFEQPVPGCRGANVIATLPPNGIDRYVLVGAHYDHLGQMGGDIYWGADDNAAAVGILAEVARNLASVRPDGRGVLFVSFDGEEPPHYLSDAMGSRRFAADPPVPLDRIDMMVCMDLVGHAFGHDGMPSDVTSSLFALGAERSEGTLAHVERMGRDVEGVVVRAADAEIIPPLSDYEAFWAREVPFLFLTSGRSRVYHTPQDTPDRLDWSKMAATAAWLERFVRDTCVREGAVRFERAGSADRATLAGLIEILGSLARMSEEAHAGLAMAQALLAACDRRGALPSQRRGELKMLVEMLESRLA